jgi:hypothetical protein
MECRTRWSTWSLASADTAVSVSFTPRGGGYYTLQLFGRDGAGRAVRVASEALCLCGWSWMPPGRPPTELAVETDSTDTLVGATATIRFEIAVRVSRCVGDGRA